MLRPVLSVDIVVAGIPGLPGSIPTAASTHTARPAAASASSNAASGSERGPRAIGLGPPVSTFSEINPAPSPSPRVPTAFRRRAVAARMLRPRIDAAIVVVMAEVPRLGGVDPFAAACAVRAAGRYRPSEYSAQLLMFPAVAPESRLSFHRLNPCHSKSGGEILTATGSGGVLLKKRSSQRSESVAAVADLLIGAS